MKLSNFSLSLCQQRGCPKARGKRTRKIEVAFDGATRRSLQRILHTRCCQPADIKQWIFQLFLLIEGCFYFTAKSPFCWSEVLRTGQLFWHIKLLLKYIFLLDMLYHQNMFYSHMGNTGQILGILLVTHVFWVFVCKLSKTKCLSSLIFFAWPLMVKPQLNTALRKFTSRSYVAHSSIENYSSGFKHGHSLWAPATEFYSHQVRGLCGPFKDLSFGVLQELLY